MEYPAVVILGAVLLIQICNESPLLAFVVFVVGGELEFFLLLLILFCVLVCSFCLCKITRSSYLGRRGKGREGGRSQVRFVVDFVCDVEYKISNLTFCCCFCFVL